MVREQQMEDLMEDLTSFPSSRCHVDEPEVVLRLKAGKANPMAHHWMPEWEGA